MSESDQPLPSPAPQGSFRETQKLFLDFVRQPLNEDYRLAPLPEDGPLSRQALHRLVKPNDRLTSEERIELYARQYWFRLIDSLTDDFPGVRAVLGDRSFFTLLHVYINQYPSKSYTLRDMGERFPAYLQNNLSLQNPKGRAAADMARLEWAKLDVFDAAEIQPINPGEMNPAQLFSTPLRLQPHIRLMQLAYPVDEWLVALHREEWRAESSNAVADRDPAQEPVSLSPKRPSLRRKIVFVAVHRLDEDVFFKRLTAPAFTFLEQLQQGCSLEAALVESQNHHRHQWSWWQHQLGIWMSEWSALKWLVPCSSL